MERWSELEATGRRKVFVDGKLWLSVRKVGLLIHKSDLNNPENVYQPEFKEDLSLFVSRRDKIEVDWDLSGLRLGFVNSFISDLLSFELNLTFENGIALFIEV